MKQLSLHEHAVQAESHLEQLATGLGQAGADPQAVDAVSNMAEGVRKIVKSLGEGQEQTAADQPPERQPATMDDATAALHQAMQASAARRGA